ncbi:MAG TPA: hypothetical protein DCS93_40965 [Microscillaceae bacterium]|nr:hypothetical protein [Microscillaceae bacterium]
MKKFKIQNLNIQEISRDAQRHINGGAGSSGCTDFYARGRDAGEGDPCEFAFSGCVGTITNGLCCI